MDTQEDFEFLKAIEKSEPDFVRAYLGDKAEMPKTEKKILSVVDCAEEIGVCSNTILNHIRAGKLKATRRNHQWLIDEGDFEAYRSSLKISYGKNNRAIIKPINNEARQEKMGYRKASSRTVADFLHTWNRNRSSGFSLLTICRDFNQVSQDPVSEQQMSGFLSRLCKKGLVIRKGKGIYQVSETIATDNSIHIEQPVIDSAAQPVTIPTVLPSYVFAKKQERLAVEEFIQNHCTIGLDFVFTISDVCEKYPHLDRVKIGKACTNMCNNGKLKKGKEMAQYVSVAKRSRKIAMKPQLQPVTGNAVLDEISQIMNSAMTAGLKEKLIKKLMG